MGASNGVLYGAVDGVSMVAQDAIRARRAFVPVPLSAGGLLGRFVKSAGLADFSHDQMTYLAWGRGMDTTKMRAVLGLEPKFTSRTAFEDFISSVGSGVPGSAAIGAAVNGLAGAATGVLTRILPTGRNS